VRLKASEGPLEVETNASLARAGYLEALTEDYLSRALRVSGASAEETPRFVAALRDRIEQLTAVARGETVALPQDRIA